jgi:predicted Zn-dependent protease with MMP-like domain
LIHLSRREFVALVRQAYRRLPPNIQRALDNVDVSVEERPAPEELELLEEEGTLFGLYTGVPLTEREGMGPVLPDRIVIYRQPIMQSCSTAEEVIEEIRITLWHEVGHYLGISEANLHRLGYG